MKIINNPPPNEWAQLLKRPHQDDTGIRDNVIAIMQDVRKRGDIAVREYTKQFDGVDISTPLVTMEEFEHAEKETDESLKSAIQTAIQNLDTFHRAQYPETVKTETTNGVSCWQKPVPIDSVGIYVPGGTAPLFSTVLMLALPAKIAGCSDIIICTPPDENGNVHPATLYAAKKAGISTVFKIGGVQAIGAMAYGTDTVPAVDKIFGPGNNFVTLAKQFVSMEGVAIDMPAGPSEVMVIADESSSPEIAAIDLLSQAEHGTDSQVILLTKSEQVAQNVQEETYRLLEELPRKEMARQSLDFSKILVMNDDEDILRVINFYAPEHLILSTQNADSIAEEVENAGSVFIGSYTPESLGDYASGTNHVLPTSGFARAFSGVNLDSFFKKITFQQATQTGLENIGEEVMTMAAAEELEAHKLAVKLRLKS